MQTTLDSSVTDVLMRDLVGHDRTPSAFLVYLWLWARTDGGRRGHPASLQTVAFETGLSKSSVQAAVRTLRNRRRLIETTATGPTTPPVYRVLTPWRRD